MKRSTNCFLVFAAFLLFSPPQARCGEGGSLVGNGAGLAELEITYAYAVRLPETIDSCLAGGGCGFSAEEESVVRRVREILALAPDPRNKLHFLSEKDLPGFFATGPNEVHRIAKTDSREHAVIFFNRDALYEHTGRAVVDMPLAASILMHELGHQTGVEDHLWLDVIGGKIRALLARTKNVVIHPSHRLAMTVYSSGVPSSVGFFLENDLSSLDLTHRTVAAIRCSTSESVSQWQIMNSHWQTPRTGRKSFQLFSTYVRYICPNREGNPNSWLAELTFAVPIAAALGKTPLIADEVALTILRTPLKQ